MREALMTLRVFVGLLWPLTTYAAGTSLGTTFGAITVADWVSLVILATSSGLVALLHRIRRSMEAEADRLAGRPVAEADRQLIDWRLFALFHLSGALFVGFLAFTLCEWLDVNSYLEAAVIALSSWRGAALADKWADTAADGLSDRIAAFFGRKDPTP